MMKQMLGVTYGRLGAHNYRPAAHKSRDRKLKLQPTPTRRYSHYSRLCYISRILPLINDPLLDLAERHFMALVGHNCSFAAAQLIIFRNVCVRTRCGFTWKFAAELLH
ncbi:unnamed protein product [Colias eurytheme]|nr:unnamed protein product [Colias eurytheme]